MSQSNNMLPIRLLVGLGNPGPDYQATRHNAGFWFIDEIVSEQHANLKADKKFHGHYAKLHIEGHEVYVLCPDTFMNLSGRAVGALCRYYGISPAEVLVVHDELDLPLGSAKLKFGGGHGGHNGLRSIIDHLHSKDFMRLRLGIGRPPGKCPPDQFVLGRASNSEQQTIMQAADQAMRVLPALLTGNAEQAMLQLHS